MIENNNNNRIKMDPTTQTTISPPLSPSPCFLLGSPAPPYAPSIPSPPTLYLSSPHNNNIGSSTSSSIPGSSTTTTNSSNSQCPTTHDHHMLNSSTSLQPPQSLSSSQHQQELPNNQLLHIPLTSSLSSVPLPTLAPISLSSSSNININHLSPQQHDEKQHYNSAQQQQPQSSPLQQQLKEEEDKGEEEEEQVEEGEEEQEEEQVNMNNHQSIPPITTLHSSTQPKVLKKDKLIYKVYKRFEPNNNKNNNDNNNNNINSTTTSNNNNNNQQQTQQQQQIQQQQQQQQETQPKQQILQKTFKRTQTEAELDQEYNNLKRKQKIQQTRDSLLNQLRSREVQRAKPGTTALQTRKFYLNVVPDKTVYNIEIPLCIIKKFTSDGEKLLCFSKDLKEIQLYRFLGYTPTYPANPTAEQKKHIDRNFSTYFKLIYSSVVPPFNEYLCKDFSLTTTCGKYFILSSYGQSVNNTAGNDPEKYIYQSASDSIGLPNPEDISFYLVRIQDGVVCDRRTFKKDVIHLAHHSGVYLYQDYFIVLSLQYQTIHMFQIKGSKFVNIHSIGPHCNQDDNLSIELAEERERPFKNLNNKQTSTSVISPMLRNPKEFLEEQTNNTNNITNTNTHPTTTTTTTTTTTANINNTTTTNNQTPSASFNISHSSPPTTPHILPGGSIVGIKQRFLSYLYKRALLSDDPKRSLSMYYSLFPQYCSLVMWKMQSLDASHLLIKFGPIDGLLGRITDYCNQICFFVVYNVHTTEVIGVYENSNKEFARTFEQFCEHFRACSCPSGLIKFRSTCSNNIFVREHLMKQKLAVVNARYGGETQAVKRILSALPFSPQSWNESPYFDKYLFSYDEKIISSTERPKPLVECPIKFYSRLSGEVKFKLNTGSQDKTDRSKKYATYIFHPYCPFIISLQHSNSNFSSQVVANFHFKSDQIEPPTMQPSPSDEISQ